MRLVVLGRTGAGKRSALCTILGLQDSEQGADSQSVQECSKHRGEAAGRQVRGSRAAGSKPETRNVPRTVLTVSFLTRKV